MNHADRRRIADALRRTAELIEQHGQEAERLAADWATPLASSSGPGPRNSVSRPTETAALSPDPMALYFDKLREDMSGAYEASVSLGALILKIVTKNRAENQRAGIGTCDGCNRYCDASTEAFRLRNGKCGACYMRDYRQRSA